MNALKIILAIVLLACAFICNADELKSEFTADPDVISCDRLPSECSAYLNDSNRFQNRVYEYNDAILISKECGKTVGNKCLYVKSNKNALTETQQDVKWFNINTSKKSREKIYSVSKTDEYTKIVALVSVGESLYIYREAIVFDYILPEKVNDKQLIIRYKLPINIFQSDNTREVTPVPESVNMVSEDICRLEYDDGCIEHWKVFIKADEYSKDKRARANLFVWTNGVGKGTSKKYSFKSNDFNKDTSSEPVYNSAPIEPLQIETKNDVSVKQAKVGNSQIQNFFVCVRNFFANCVSTIKNLA